VSDCEVIVAVVRVVRFGVTSLSSLASFVCRAAFVVGGGGLFLLGLLACVLV